LHPVQLPPRALGTRGATGTAAQHPFSGTLRDLGQPIDSTVPPNSPAFALSNVRHDTDSSHRLFRHRHSSRGVWFGHFWTRLSAEW